MTYTYAELEVSRATYEEVRAKLDAAGYGHAINPRTGAIDMHGLALVRSEAAAEEEAEEMRQRLEEVAPGWLERREARGGSGE